MEPKVAGECAISTPTILFLNHCVLSLGEQHDKIYISLRDKLYPEEEYNIWDYFQASTLVAPSRDCFNVP